MPPIDPRRFEEKMLIDAIWLWQNPATVEGLPKALKHPEFSNMATSRIFNSTSNQQGTLLLTHQRLNRMLRQR